MTRTVFLQTTPITFTLERKAVKNLNLRIRADGSVYISASPRVPVGVIDDFVRANGARICTAMARFAEAARQAPPPRQYEDGELLPLLGQTLPLRLAAGAPGAVQDGGELRQTVPDPDDFAARERVAAQFYDAQCRAVFGEGMAEAVPRFAPFGVETPALRIRTMKSRWGSCIPAKGIVTLNRRLIEHPRACIEYVAVHELCHFLEANHSPRFYGWLDAMLPDWRARRAVLEGRGGDE